MSVLCVGGKPWGQSCNVMDGSSRLRPSERIIQAHLQKHTWVWVGYDQVIEPTSSFKLGTN